MKLKELKHQVDFALSQLREGDEDLDVIIPNNLPSMGHIGATNVRGASRGFDWDSGSFIIYPEKEMTNVPGKS